MEETLGSRIQRLRKRCNLKQEELASKLNITAQAVSKWENDLSSPDISVLPTLADIFNVSLDELLGRETVKTEVIPLEERKDINKMILHIHIHSTDGDKVKVNIPLSIIMACVNMGAEVPSIGGKDALKNVDFKEIIKFIEQGMVGELLSVETSDGDIITIRVD